MEQRFQPVGLKLRENRSSIERITRAISYTARWVLRLAATGRNNAESIYFRYHSTQK